MTTAIESPKTDTEKKTVFNGLIPKILGDRYAVLPLPIQKLHAGESACEVSGVCEVFPASNILTTIAAKLGGMPSVGKDVPVVLAIHPSEGAETWARRFGPTLLTTVQKERVGKGQLVEFLGPGGVVLNVDATDEGLFLNSCGLLLFGVIPVPSLFSPKINAKETVLPDGNVAFDVEIAAPFLGRMVAYKGVLSV